MNNYVYKDDSLDIVFNTAKGLSEYLNENNKHVGYIKFDLDESTEECNQSLSSTIKNFEKVISEGWDTFFINTVPNGMYKFDKIKLM